MHRVNFWSQDFTTGLLQQLVIAAYPDLAKKGQHATNILRHQLTYYGELEDLYAIMNESKWLCVIPNQNKAQRQIVQIVRRQVHELPRMLARALFYRDSGPCVEIHYYESELLLDVLRAAPFNEMADPLWFLYHSPCPSASLRTFTERAFTILNVCEELAAVKESMERLLGGGLSPLEFIFNNSAR
jgi:hypothetical protein